MTVKYVPMYIVMSSVADPNKDSDLIRIKLQDFASKDPDPNLDPDPN